MFEVLTSVVAGFFSALITWLFTRRKNQAEAQSNEIDNAKKNAEYYQLLLDDLMARHKTLLNDLNTATETIRAKDKQIEELLKVIRELTEELKTYKQLSKSNDTPSTPGN